MVHSDEQIEFSFSSINTNGISARAAGTVTWLGGNITPWLLLLLLLSR